MVQRHREEGENTSLVDGGFRYESKCKRPPERGGKGGAAAATALKRRNPSIAPFQRGVAAQTADRQGGRLLFVAVFVIAGPATNCYIRVICCRQLGSSMNHILGWMTVRKSYSYAFEQGPLSVLFVVHASKRDGISG